MWSCYNQFNLLQSLQIKIRQYIYMISRSCTLVQESCKLKINKIKLKLKDINDWKITKKKKKLLFGVNIWL